MPKETIYGAAVHTTTIGTTGHESITSEPWRVDVAWGRDTHAQLATLTHDGLGIKTVDPDSPDGLWVDLDRDSINALIRVLRKARDQAFGADE